MSTELNNLIASLSEDNFKKLIQAYARQKYKTPYVRIIDGPYDGGNDLEIIIGSHEIKKNIQITVQKTGFEKKLELDLGKAKSNMTKFGYMNIMDFYITQNVSKDKRNELELNAEINFGIKLNIIDGNILSQEASTYDSIREAAYNSHDITLPDTPFTDKQSKVLFDVLTHSNNTVEIKKNFITAYIYSYLFANPLSNLIEIYEYINELLNSTLDKDFIHNELNNLRSKKLLVSAEDKSKFSLSPEKFSEINLIYNGVNSEEASFIGSVENYILENNLDTDKEELIEYLYKLYKENYTIDIDEINQTNDSFNPSFRKTFNDLNSFFIKKGFEDEKAKLISVDLLKICSENEFLTKLSTVYLFNNLYASNKLEKYLNSKEQVLFVDTQILIRLLCVMSADKHDFQDSALQSVKILYNTFEKNNSIVSLISSYDYIEEVSNHIIEALKLQKFLELPFFSKLGKSKNIFYNTFLELKENYELEDGDDFQFYMSNLLGIQQDDLFVDNFEHLKRMLSQKISLIFEFAGFELIYHPQYSNFYKVKQEYETILAYQSKFRSNSAIENDVRTLIFLSNKENNTNIENGEYNEPFLITWDSFFYTIRKKMMESPKEHGYWYIYTPLKLVDRLSIMNFNLNPESINLNIIALTESNFNNSSKTVAFIDVISSFFNTKDVTKLTIINRLADLQGQTRAVDITPAVEEFKERDEDNELTNLLLRLKNHYNSYGNNYNFKHLIKLFEIKEFETNVIDILNKSLKEEAFNMFKEFDILIESNITNETES